MEDQQPEGARKNETKASIYVQKFDSRNCATGRKGKDVVRPRNKDAVAPRELQHGTVHGREDVFDAEHVVGWRFRLDFWQELTTQKITSIKASGMVRIDKALIVQEQATVNKLAFLSNSGTKLLEAVATRCCFLPHNERKTLVPLIFTTAELLADGNVEISILAENTDLNELREQAWILPFRHIDSWNDGERYSIAIKNIRTSDWEFAIKGFHDSAIVNIKLRDWQLMTRMNKARAFLDIVEKNIQRMPTLLEYPRQDIS